MNTAVCLYMKLSKRILNTKDNIYLFILDLNEMMDVHPTLTIIHDICQSNHYAVHFKLKKHHISICYCYCWVIESCQTLWDPMDCSPPGSSVHGIFQARALEWVAISFSRGSSQPRDQTLVFHITCTAGRFFPAEPPGSMSITSQ